MDRLRNSELGTAEFGKLDGVMRSAARLILKRQRYDHISNLMTSQLHWLDITARIKYKMCMFALSLPAEHCSTVSVGILHSSCNTVWSISSAIPLLLAACLYQHVGQ